MSLVVYDIPSKRRFDLLQLTLEYIRDGKPMKELAQAIDQHIRHAHFLAQNATILGFLKRQGPFWLITKAGEEFMSTSHERKGLILAQAILDSRFVSFLLSSVDSIEEVAGMSIQQISNLLMENTILSEEHPEMMQKTTADRRASSVKQWFTWLNESLPRIADENEDEFEHDSQDTLNHIY